MIPSSISTATFHQAIRTGIFRVQFQKCTSQTRFHHSVIISLKTLLLGKAQTNVDPVSLPMHLSAARIPSAKNRLLCKVSRNRSSANWACCKQSSRLWTWLASIKLQRKKKWLPRSKKDLAWTCSLSSVVLSHSQPGCLRPVSRTYPMTILVIMRVLLPPQADLYIHTIGKKK